MEDLGARFARDQRFCFDHIFIHEIIFDDTNDVTLYCTVPYFGQMYIANFGLTFEQLNILLRSIRSNGTAATTAIAEILNGELEIPSVLDVVSVYGHPLEINNCILETTLFDLSEEDEDDFDDEEDFKNFDPFAQQQDDDEDEDDEDEDDEHDEGPYEAYAFLIDEIRPLFPLN